ncbi:hypothetical protein DZA50_01770 [Kangiella sp. HD9-110m-PIT-SAG07]|nr:hypothetical protein DZA50_01770 [Kangiella sp. HD9-110m-PIT-SAG07]
MSYQFPTKQSGASLVLVMLFFVALTVVGLAVMRSGILSQKQANNIHEKSVSFHIAQTSNNAVTQSYRDRLPGGFQEAYVNGTVLPAPNTGHIPTLLAHTNSFTTCVGEDGKIAECGDSPTIDNGGTDGVLVAQTENFYRGCARGGFSCPGMSSGIGDDNNLGCSFFEHRGKGFIDVDGDYAEAGDTITEINQWSQTVQACEYSIE